MSVAHSRGAVQLELEQVLLMLINCIAVFQHSVAAYFLLLLYWTQLYPEAS